MNIITIQMHMITKHLIKITTIALKTKRIYIHIQAEMNIIPKDLIILLALKIFIKKPKIPNNTLPNHLFFKIHPNHFLVIITRKF